jgi:hypothetical protein
MLHAYDRATIAHLLTLKLDPALHRLLSERITEMSEELLDHTEIVVVESGDTEDDIVRAIGLSPMVEPINGARFGEEGFWPHWDFLTDHGGWFEMVVTFGSTFAYVLLFERSGNSAFADFCERFCGDLGTR